MVPTAYDRHCIAKLIELGLLTKIMPERLAVDTGVIIGLCSDGHQFVDAYGHIAVMCNEAVQAPCIHPVALNGGALLMSSMHMPEEQRRHGDTMFENILGASEIKKISDVFLYTHFPCAIAGANGMGVVDQGLCLMEAKKRLKQANPNFRVSCFFHVYEQDGNSPPKRRTYFLPKEKWNNPESFIPVLHEFRSMFRR